MLTRPCQTGPGVRHVCSNCPSRINPQEYAQNNLAPGWSAVHCRENRIGGMDLGAATALASLTINPVTRGEPTLGVYPRARSNMLSTQLCQSIPDDDGVPIVHLDGIPISAVLGKIGTEMFVTKRPSVVCRSGG